MENQKMFCFQCQETAKGTGCTVKGVCGKQVPTARLMDELLAAARAAAWLACKTSCKDGGEEWLRSMGRQLADALFSTITNANFSDESLRRKRDAMLRLRDELKVKAEKRGVGIPDWPGMAFGGDGRSCGIEEIGVLRTADEDVRSLKELVAYGLKGIAAYYDHAARLGKENAEIIKFVCSALAATADPLADRETLLRLVMETGSMGVEAMALLDAANTEAYGNPEITEVSIGTRKNPGILISGHDLHDIDQLLEQTAGTGIDIYTHSEMLPAHYYPKLKRFPHLAGNYGGAWWQQREEMERFHGPVIFTSNCIVPPRPDSTYANRAFTLNATGYPGWRHIPEDESGRKDFTEVIAMARQSAPPDEIEKGTIVGGFAHEQTAALADKIVSGIRSGAVSRLVVMSGCDGRMKSREYYTEYARQLPPDTLILTSGCAKYRYIKLPLGKIGELPRVLDAGQCNDSYSWAITALRLKEALGLHDVGELPVTFNIAWYEQKAVIVLLALLSLGFKDIRLGPTLPAFLSPGVGKVLRDEFGLAPAAC